MNNKIKEKLNNISISSGVYIMKDVNGTVIYVGKAKNLKNRVSQYFNNSNKLPKVKAMVDHIDDFEYFITLSEQDAFALENNLIKEYQPFYNILLKDSKTFAYIKINLKESFPFFEVTRKIKDDGAKYFGPYITGVSAYDVLNLLNIAFPLRKCRGKITHKNNNACLNYSLGLCKAPCNNMISKEDYKKIVEQAIDFLKGNDSGVEQIITKNMQEYANDENFEKALEMREYLKIIKKLKERVISNIPKNISFDAFGYVTDEEYGAICVLTIRAGKILGIEDYSINDGSVSDEETLQEFIIAYYKDKQLPDEILTNIDVNNDEFMEYLFKQKNKKTNVFCPKISIKANIIKMAEENAREHLFKRVKDDKLKFKKTIGALIGLKDILNLLKIPSRIECYDISHLSGTNSVASMVVFENGEPAKKLYRKFKIKYVQKNDDFASLSEILGRRIEELNKKQDESFSKKPDLIVIDGGKGQLSSTKQVLDNCGLKNISIISLAKQFEEIFTTNSNEPITLKRSSEELKLLQRIRDEAHRFAITFHRSLRNKNTFIDPIDSIKGIGKTKRQALYEQFGSIENIKNASIEQLELVAKINKQDAVNIYVFFHNQDK